MSRPCQLPGALLALVVAGSLNAQPPVSAQHLPSLAERMAHHRVPGVSIAVVDSCRIVWAHGFGVRIAGKNDSVTSRTLFQAASISKPIAATGMLRLVERGILALDEDVNAYLKMWRVPTSAYAVTQRGVRKPSGAMITHLPSCDDVFRMKCNDVVGLEELRELWRAVEPPDQASVAIIRNFHPHLLCADAVPFFLSSAS